jgi:iron complex transport system ATP-binding protein
MPRSGPGARGPDHPLSPRSLAMPEGRVIATGTPAEIMDPTLLEGIYGLPVAVHELDSQLIATYYH